VYCITNTKTGRQYIGKKLFFSMRAKIIKGKRKRVKKESDWKEYYGSSEDLQQDVELLGTEIFLREILYLCKSKGECSYKEAREQFDRKVLESNDYYNQFIGCKIHKKHLTKMNDNDYYLDGKNNA
jgi:hypothetical protein